MVQDWNDNIYKTIFKMQLMDIKGFRRLRTIGQVVFESSP